MDNYEDLDRRDFDESERQRLRALLDHVYGNGKVGLSTRVRRIEWGWAVMSGILTALITAISAGLIRLTP